MFQARSVKLLELIKVRNNYTGFLNGRRSCVSCWNKIPRRFHSSETITHPLTKREALSFLEEKLEIPNPEKFATEDKHSFLKTLLKQMKYKLPFTTVPDFTNAGTVKMLDINELNNNIMMMKGGSCIALTSFTHAALNHLNIKTFIIMCSVYRWRNHIFDNHVGLLVHDLTRPGSKHILDVGSRYFVPPVDIDFTRVSPTYTLRNMSYKYFNASPGVFHFCTKVEEDELKLSPHGNESRLVYYEGEHCWEVMTVFRTAKLHNLEGVLNVYHDTMSHPELGPKIHEFLVLVGYPNKLMVNITQKQFTTMTEDGHKEMKRITSKDHLIETALKYFPQYTEEEIRNAAKYYFN